MKSLDKNQLSETILFNKMLLKEGNKIYSQKGGLMHDNQIKVFHATNEQFDGRTMTENLDEAYKRLELAYYALYWIARSTQSGEFKRKDVAQLQFIGNKAQKVGEVGKCLSDIHEFTLQEGIKLF